MKRIQLKDISRVLESALQACCAGFMTCTRALLPLHASAWKAVSEPVQNLLDANDAEQEHLVRLWLQHTSSQLNIICITVSKKTIM
jgi:hypothetical protein